jgi:hypothetical protein
MAHSLNHNLIQVINSLNIINMHMPLSLTGTCMLFSALLAGGAADPLFNSLAKVSARCTLLALE